MAEITTIEQINDKLSVMDALIAKALETGKAEFELFNITLREVAIAIYGDYRKRVPIKPTFTGHLHVKKEFEYLLDSLKNWC